LLCLFLRQSLGAIVAWKVLRMTRAMSPNAGELLPRPPSEGSSAPLAVEHPKPKDTGPHREIELKLRVDPDGLARLQRSPWWRGLGPVRRQSLHSTYFDTDDHDLRDHNITMRTRSDGKSILQTVKLKQDPSDSVSRSEWETVIPDPVPDPSLVIDPTLPPAFRRLTSADLRPVFAIDVKRQTRRLVADQAQIEISLDDGTAAAGGEQEPIHEVELELVEGDVGALFAEARRLSDSVGGRLHVRTKSDLGYELLDPARRHWSRAPELRLTPEMSVNESFRLIVLSAFAHLTANDDCARLDLHVEGVHQCRIALRRLRSAFKIHGPLLRRKRIKAIDAEIRWLAKILGTARDLDVLQTELIEPAMESLGDGEDLTPLLKNLAGKKAAAYAQVGEALGSERYRHLLIDLCALGYDGTIAKADRKAGLEQPLERFAATALSSLHRKLMKRGQGFESLSMEERHEVRIALKRLRYAVDFFAGIFDSDRKGKFLKRLSRLQDDLGGMNDVAVAETLLMRLIGVGGTADSAAPPGNGKLVFAAGAILGWHRRRAAEINRELVKDWQAFARAKPFWLQS
jgi:inorganic triphosphatase YgiF